MNDMFKKQQGQRDRNGVNTGDETTEVTEGLKPMESMMRTQAFTLLAGERQQIFGATAEEKTVQNK